MWAPHGGHGKNQEIGGLAEAFLELQKSTPLGHLYQEASPRRDFLLVFYDYPLEFMELGQRYCH